MTEAITSIKPILAVVCPLLAAPAILLLRQRPNLREGTTLIAAVIQFAIIVSMAPAIVGGDRIVFRIIDIGAGIEVGYRVDAPRYAWFPSRFSAFQFFPFDCMF